MTETLWVWYLVLICQMADGSLSVGAVPKDSRRHCIQDSGEIVKKVDEAKANGVIRSYALECQVIELPIVRK
jgi:hypothetical protein